MTIIAMFGWFNILMQSIAWKWLISTNTTSSKAISLQLFSLRHITDFSSTERTFYQNVFIFWNISFRINKSIIFIFSHHTPNLVNIFGRTKINLNLSLWYRIIILKTEQQSDSLRILWTNNIYAMFSESCMKYDDWLLFAQRTCFLVGYY